MFYNQHIIKKQVLEFKAPDQQRARELQELVSHVYKTKVTPLLNKICEKYDYDDSVIQIENLELDLGRLSEETLAEELPQKIEALFEEELSKRIYYLAQDGFKNASSDTLISTGKSQLSSFTHYLRNGAFPWNGNPAKKQINALFRELLKDCKQALKEALILQLNQAIVRKRLIYQLDESELASVVSLLVPAQSKAVIALKNELILTHKSEQFSGNSNEKFDEMVWDVILVNCIQTNHSRSLESAILKDLIIQVSSFKIGPKVLDIEVAHLLGRIISEQQKLGSKIKSSSLIRLANLYHADLLRKGKEIKENWKELKNNKQQKQSEEVVTPENDQSLLVESPKSHIDSTHEEKNTSVDSSERVLSVKDVSENEFNANESKRLERAENDPEKDLPEKQNQNTSSEKDELSNNTVNQSPIVNSEEVLNDEIDTDLSENNTTLIKQTEKFEGKTAMKSDNGVTIDSKNQSDNQIDPSGNEISNESNPADHQGAQQEKNLKNPENRQELKVITGKENKLSKYVSDKSPIQDNQVKDSITYSEREKEEKPKHRDTDKSADEDIQENADDAKNSALKSSEREQVSKSDYQKSSEKLGESISAEKEDIIGLDQNESESIVSEEIAKNNLLESKPDSQDLEKSDGSEKELINTEADATKSSTEELDNSQLSGESEVSESLEEQQRIDEILAQQRTLRIKRTQLRNGFKEQLEPPKSSKGDKKESPPILWKGSTKPLEEAYINNAGLVLIWPFLPTLFKGLEWMEDKAFKSEELQHKALWFLEYLVTGATDSDESELVLNKLLVGLKAETPVPNEIELSLAEKEEAEHLLTVVIQNWSVLKGTSVEGFRATFLRKEGHLKKDFTGWKLHVERATMDVLLEKLPWSYSVIKLPWVTEMIYVEW